ncbi:hypothetical protein D9M68_528750 [compost metagenome]
MLVQAEHADRERGDDHRDQDARHALEALQGQDQRQAAGADGKAVPVGLPGQDGAAQRDHLTQRAGILDRDGEQLGQLADQHGQGDAVHIAVADRLGQQFGDEAEAQQPHHDADHARDHRHHAGHQDGARRIAAGNLQDHGEDRRGQGRIRPQHQDPARPEQGVDQQRDHGGVEPVDAGHAEGLGIGDADRHQHGGQYQPRGQVARQPVRPIGLQHQDAWKPAQPHGGLAGVSSCKGRQFPGFHEQPSRATRIDYRRWRHGHAMPRTWRMPAAPGRERLPRLAPRAPALLVFPHCP